MTRAKSNGGTRVIVNLSWPIGASVNDNVPDNVFDFMSFDFKYPTIDNIVQKKSQIGPSALLYKMDLKRSHRNLKIDPMDCEVLGLSWRQRTYVALPGFGFKHVRQGALL